MNSVIVSVLNNLATSPPLAIDR